MEYVLKNFKRGTSGVSYNALKAQVELLPAVGLIPELKEYIFGIDEDVLSERLKSAKGFMLFVEFGTINGTETQPGMVVESAMQLAVSIGYNGDNKSRDEVELMLIRGECLRMLNVLLGQMLADRKAKNCDMLRGFDVPKQVFPIPQKALFGVIGYTTFIELQIIE
jgi:hypothetical protein